MALRSILLSAGIVLGAAAALVPLAIAPQGCSIHNCEGQTTDYVVKEAGTYLGDMPDDNTWETTPLLGVWLDFPGQQGYILHTPPGRVVKNARAYLSVDPSPSDPDVNFAEAAGNLAEFRDYHPADPTHPGFIIVQNDTCSHYYVRVVLDLEPGFTVGVGAATPDGGYAD